MTMGRVAMVVFSHYPADPRPRREAEALIEAGFAVDILCLREDGAPRKEMVNGVQVYRLPVRRKRGSKIRYLWEYAIFGILAFFKISMLQLRNRYCVFHAHNMPDALIFCGLLPWLMGARMILDLHDPMPEVYMAKYNLPANHPVIRVLRIQEKISIGFAHLVLTPNIAFQDLFVERGCPQEKIQIVMNSPQEEMFRPVKTESANPAPRDRNKPIIMFHGTVVERHGLDTAVQALLRLRLEFPEVCLFIFGDGDYAPQLKNSIQENALEKNIAYLGKVSLERIAATIEKVDLGIIPNKRSAFTEINMPTRVFEYLCKGVPVVAPRTKGIQDYFGEDDLFWFEPEDPEDLCRAIRSALFDRERRVEILKRGMAIYRRHAWRQEKQNMVARVCDLLSEKAPVPQKSSDSISQKKYSAGK